MGTEIERKFLVVGSGWEDAPFKYIKQGYLSNDPDRTVRIRVMDSTAFITIKGRSKGITRAEFEYTIPHNEALELLNMCTNQIICKKRFFVKVHGTTWEVDLFEGAHTGLVLAEVELTSEHQDFQKPQWLGKEVSEDHRFTNSYLSQNPFNPLHTDS
ncbi:MAG: adenylate cyclase [Proteobacteria bacterium]|nr:adenylate cyclase [Pseudomonadota bacterium]